MKIVFILTAVALLIIFVPGLPVEACWVYLSTGDLVEQSDLIVIGEIKGISGTKQVEGMWVTCWNVEVHYYMKGNPDSSMLTVITPGARNKQPLISTHYHLDEWGSTVLLCDAAGYNNCGKIRPSRNPRCSGWNTRHEQP